MKEVSHPHIPNKVVIAGEIWDVKKNPKEGGGAFWGGEHLIEIGTKNKKEIKMIFLHEVVEAILTKRGHRYNSLSECANDGYRFVLDHSEFENAIRDLSLALSDTWKVT